MKKNYIGLYTFYNFNILINLYFNKFDINYYIILDHINKLINKIITFKIYAVNMWDRIINLTVLVNVQQLGQWCDLIGQKQVHTNWTKSKGWFHRLHRQSKDQTRPPFTGTFCRPNCTQSCKWSTPLHRLCSLLLSFL